MLKNQVLCYAAQIPASSLESETQGICKMAWEPWGEGTRSKRAQAWLPGLVSAKRDLFTAVLLPGSLGRGWTMHWKVLGKVFCIRKVSFWRATCHFWIWDVQRNMLMCNTATEKHVYDCSLKLPEILYVHRPFTRCHIKWCLSINVRSISPKMRSDSAQHSMELRAED